MSIPILIKALQDEKPRVRAHAATALGEISPKTKAVIPALVKALNDELRAILSML